MNLARRIMFSFALSGIMVGGAVAGGFQLNEHGARAMAQAGAFAARASDGSAIFFNPAGLAFQDRPSFYGGVTAVIPTVSFYGPLQFNTNQQTKAPSQFFSPVNAYLTLPVMDRLHVGIGVNNPYGLGSEWPDNWVGRYLTTKVNLQSFFFTGVASYKLLDNLSIAGGFSYVTGNVTLDRAVAIPLQPKTGLDPRVSMDLSGTSTGWSAGALYKLTPEVSIGASYRSAVAMDASGTAKFTPDYTELGFPEGDVSAALELPATGFVGIAYAPADQNYQVEADYQYIGWSSYNELAFNFKSNNSRIVQPKNYKDTYILRVGGEYTLTDLHLRGGYFYDHSPVQSQYVDPILPDADRNGINLGLGYDFTRNFSVDVSYLLLLFSERKAENTIPEISFDGTYHTRVHLIGLNLGYTL